MSVTLTPSQVANDSVASAYARWRATVEAELKGVPFEKKLVTRTAEGIALQPLYTRADVAALADVTTLPGEAPYHRGVRPFGYKLDRWEVAQQIAADSPAEFNAALLPDLLTGQNSVVLTPDATARLGLNRDDAPARAADATGVPITNVEDMSQALNGVDLAMIPVHLRTGADPLPLAAIYLEYVRRRGTGWTSLSGGLTADPIGEWLEHGQLPAPIETLFQSLADWTAWAETYLPELRTIGVDATAWSEAGATAVQELGFALATSAEYLRALQARGAGPAAAAPRIDFSLSVGPQFFMEIAKFRALRPLWTRVVTAFGGAPELATAATVSASTGRWDKTLLDPHVNLLRVTTEALSAVLGGCDRLHVAPFDEVTGATSDFSRRIARNVHTLLAEEFSFAQTADPAGGSWYVEKLTDELARAAWKVFQDIEARGGMLAALREGYPQGLVTATARDKRDAIAKRRISLVGTNLFPNLKEKPLKMHVREQPAPKEKKNAPRAWPAAHGDWVTRFAAALSAAKDGATVAELGGFTRARTGEAGLIQGVARWRAAEDFEQLREATAAWAERTGARPKVFLAKMGPPLQHKARADFSAGFFAVGGFELAGKQSFATPEEAAQAAVASGAAIAVLCSTDETYPMLVPAFAQAVKAAAPRLIVVVAGLPADVATVAAYRGAGVDEFIHIRANVYEVLAKFSKQIGILS